MLHSSLVIHRHHSLIWLQAYKMGLIVKLTDSGKRESLGTSAAAENTWHLSWLPLIYVPMLYTGIAPLTVVELHLLKMWPSVFFTLEEYNILLDKTKTKLWCIIHWICIKFCYTEKHKNSYSCTLRALVNIWKYSCYSLQCHPFHQHSRPTVNEKKIVF